MSILSDHSTGSNLMRMPPLEYQHSLPMRTPHASLTASQQDIQGSMTFFQDLEVKDLEFRV